MPAHRGPHHPLFFGNGRWQVYGRDRRSYRWARIVMENELGRPLMESEHVHHINGDKTDDRPANLEILSRSEHSRLHKQHMREWTHCTNGHEFTPENTELRGERGWRQCRECARQAKRRYKQRQRASRTAA